MTSPTTTSLSIGGQPSAPAWLQAVAGSLTDALPVAKMLAASGLVPKAYDGKPEAILIAAAMGARLGLDLFSSLSGIAVINYRPTLWGDAMLAVCQSRLDWRGMLVSWSDDGKAVGVTIRRAIHGGTDEYVGRFSENDAKTAGLLGKQGPWTQYPARMIEMRARSFALRGIYADALEGFACREEMEDVVDVSASVRVHPSVPEPVPGKVREIPQNLPSDTAASDAAQAQENPIPAAAAPTEGKATVETIQVIAKRIHENHKAKGAAELWAIVGKLGVAKLSECPAEKLETASILLLSAERALIAGV